MLADAIEDTHAARVLLQLLNPDCRRYLPPAVMAMLHPPQRTVRGSSGKMVTDAEGDEVRYGCWRCVGVCVCGGGGATEAFEVLGC